MQRKKNSSVISENSYRSEEAITDYFNLHLIHLPPQSSNYFRSLKWIGHWGCLNNVSSYNYFLPPTSECVTETPQTMHVITIYKSNYF